MTFFPPGSRDNVSPSADKHGTSELQTKTCSDPGTEKKTPVTFEQVPGLFTKELSPQDSSQAGGAWGSQEHLRCGTAEPAPEEKKTQASRSLMKLRRRTKVLASDKKESVCDVHLIYTGEMVKNQIASTEELRSPVFRRSGLSNTEEGAERGSRPALVQRAENGFAPLDAAVGAAQDTRDDFVPPGAPELSPCAPGDSSNVRQPECPRAAAPSGNQEPAWPCLENSDSVLLDTSGDGGKDSSSVTEQTHSESMCGDQEELHRLLDFMSENDVFPADRNKSINTKSKSHEGNQSDTKSLNNFPTVLGNIEELSENQQLEIQSKLSHPEEVAAPESTLNSCTVVEGLLFPVEYYVRTTRRMASCQRKVDLDAVILSQLGKSKKSQRSKCKQKDANSDQPSQERAENDLESEIVPFPFLGAENDPANSSSPQKSPAMSSGSSTSLGSISQNSVTGTNRSQRRLQRKQKGRRKSTCKAPVHQVSQEPRESLDLTAPREGSLLSRECQSEKENCEKSSSAERRLVAAATRGETEVMGAVQPAGADPAAGSQVLGKCWNPPLEQVQNPLQNSDSQNPGNETFASHTGEPATNLGVCWADKCPVEHVKNRDVRGACGAKQLLEINVPPRRSLRSSVRQGAGRVPKGT